MEDRGATFESGEHEVTCSYTHLYYNIIFLVFVFVCVSLCLPLSRAHKDTRVFQRIQFNIQYPPPI